MKKIQGKNGEDIDVPLSTNPLLTQKFVNYTPKINVGCASCYFIVLSVVLVVFGVPFIIQSNKVFEVGIDYTNW